MDKTQRQAIRSIIQDARFRAIENLQKIVIQEISGYAVKADDEFNTMWRTAKREAGVEVLQDFFGRLIFEASKNDKD